MAGSLTGKCPDGAHNDSRMNVSLAVTAALYGATVVNHMEVTALEKDASGRLNGARVKDLVPGKNGKEVNEFSVRAKVCCMNTSAPRRGGVWRRC